MQENKRKRGRPAGSVSFQQITLAELNAKFGPDTIIPVGRLFLKGQVIVQKAKAESIKFVAVEVAQPKAETPKVEMVLSV